MRVELVVDPATFAGPVPFANWVRANLVIMVAVNRLLIKKGKLPKLYKSGVRFREEPSGVETFVDGLTCARKGYGDCAHLGAWRCAELQELGEAATLRIKWRHPTYHVQVRRKVRVNQAGVDDPFVEDPSRFLGMKGSM